MSDKQQIILIAPNVGEQMGGEAIKALQIFRELSRVLPNTIQITHERNRAELTGRLQLSNVHYVSDTRFSLFLWRSRVLSWLIDVWFSWKAVRLAEAIVEMKQMESSDVIIHQTEPNSPVMPRYLSSRHLNVFGPINGNIYYPACFRRNETLLARLRRIFHMPIQRLNRAFFSGISRADLVLCAGGFRTRHSLLTAGCAPEILVDTVDCGIGDNILDRPRNKQSGINYRFVHFGRLVFHKGTALIIESLARTQLPICIDIIGRGPELERCRKLAETVGVAERVAFLDWFPSHDQLLDSFEQYRGVLLPSIEDANGIVVQEAMGIGLPCICLDWGGPKLLINDGISGFLIDPKSREYIIEQIAERLDQMAGDEVLAEKMSVAAKSEAQRWRWSAVVKEWLALYPSELGSLLRQNRDSDISGTKSL